MIKNLRITKSELHKVGKAAAALLFCCIFSAAIFGVPAIYFSASYAEAAYAESGEGGSDFAGGDGSDQNPFQIETAAQLDNVRKYTARYGYDGVTYAGKHFRLTRDIDLTGYLSEGKGGYNGGKGWEPVGSSDSYPETITDDFFSGSFDGGKHTVTGLWINRPDENAVGFFGNIQNANIEDLNIVLADEGITGGFNADKQEFTGYTGGLAGFAVDGSIKKCSVTGNVTAVGKAGGGEYSLGGLFGSINNNIVSECLFEGKVGYMPSEAAGGEYTEFCGAGGIAGRAAYECEIKNCFVRAEIAGSEGFTEYTGGLSGSYFSAVKTATCFIEITGGKAFPFFGNQSLGGNAPVITDCYYYGGGDVIREFDVSHHFAGSTFARLTAEQLSDKSSFAGFDFDSIWGFDTESRLVLKTFGKAAPPPPDLTWLLITLGALALVTAAGGVGGYVANKRKKPIIITNSETVEIIKEVEKEVPVSRGEALPMGLFTPAEKRVAKLLALGKSRRKIAEELKLAENTVKVHTRNIFDKVEVQNQSAFIARYIYDDRYFDEN